MTNVGIIGLGTYLPPLVRTNDYWPAHVVATWGERTAARATRGDASELDQLPEAMRATLAGMMEFAKDPFRGSRERRVMPEGMTSSEMEAIAAREAIQRAGLRPDQIDAVLIQTPIPEYLVVNNSCATHKLVELPRRCMAIATNVACNAFALHASIAQGLIASGQARNVLSIHSSAITRITPIEQPESAWWGDGASAAVFGVVSDGKGIVAAAHHADGTNCDALVLGIPDRRWWEDGLVTYYSADRTRLRPMLLSLVDRAREAIGGALATAGLSPSQVDFFATHQGAAFYTKTCAINSGLENAKTLITFPVFGNVNSVAIPLILAMAEREGMIRDGSIISTFAGGAGETWSSLVMRWGR